MVSARPVVGMILSIAAANAELSCEVFPFCISLVAAGRPVGLFRAVGVTRQRNMGHQ